MTALLTLSQFEMFLQNLDESTNNFKKVLEQQIRRWRWLAYAWQELEEEKGSKGFICKELWSLSESKIEVILPRLDLELQVMTIMTRRGSLMPWLRKEFNEQKGSGSGLRI